MAKENLRIQYLLRVWSSRTITAAEERELAAWIRENDSQSELHAHVKELVDQYKTGELLPAVDWERVFEKIQASKMDSTEETPAPVVRVHRLHFINRSWFRWAAAAAIIFAIITAAIVVSSDRQTKKSGTDLSHNPSDVSAPTATKAVVTLADGRTVSLDSLQDGLLAQQGSVKLVKLADGQIAYQTASGEIVKELQYNTLTNPRGSKVIDIGLADGSHVWLNAGSRVTYPVAFNGSERKVTMTGEGYFEVNPQPLKGGEKRPFLVEANGVTTQVLGTHFNVNAYEDEKDIRVTLLEGSVAVKSGNSNVKIAPGEQAVASSQLAVNRNVDVEAVMAWKNGYFSFAGADLATVLRQLGRWYAVEFEINGTLPDRRFGGEISRTSNLSQVLNVLQHSQVHFTIQGRKIIISP